MQNKKIIMKRRDTIKLLFGMLAVSGIKYKAFAMQDEMETKMIKPKKLSEGDTVGVIAPGSAAASPEDLFKAEEISNLLNIELKFGNNLINGSGIKTRTINERLDDLHQMFDDKSINAVFAIRGGYGSAQLLDKIDYELIKNNPKIFVGYSDITAIHNAFNQRTGLVTFHGPLLLSPFTEWTFENFRSVLFRNEIIGNISNPDKKDGVRTMFPLQTVTGGKAKGRLTGGNLTIISSLMGTPFEIDTKDKILFIEDVGEPPYKIDRMLTQLKLAGKLQQAKGIIVGKCHDCEPGMTRGTWDLVFSEVIERIIKPLNIPCFTGLMIGHTKDQITIPSGLEAEMDADNTTIRIDESAVI
jgi:muramoyltetrapeptide carboxypeptidase